MSGEIKMSENGTCGLDDALCEVLNRHLTGDDLEQVAERCRVDAGDLNVETLAQMVAGTWFANLYEEMEYMVDTLVEQGEVEVRE